MVSNLEQELVGILLLKYIQKNEIHKIILNEINNYLLKNENLEKYNIINEINDLTLKKNNLKLIFKIKDYIIDFWFEKEHNNNYYNKATHVFAFPKNFLIETVRNCQLI